MMAASSTETGFHRLPAPPRFTFIAALLLGSPCILSLGAADYPSPEAVEDDLRALARDSGGVLTLEKLGETREKRPITAAVLALPGPKVLRDRQSILVVANLEGNLHHSTAVVLEVLRQLVRRRDEPAVKERLGDAALVFIPQASPDAAARISERPLRESTRNARPVDEDRDRAVDEDGPEDLDGDGEILAMRIPDSEGPLVIDAADSRMLRPARAEDAGSARFRLAVEGVDSDGDGLIGEDPPGGVDIALNFPHDHAPREPETGSHPGSEPESRGILELVFASPGLEVAVIYGAEDNLVSPPEGRDGPPERRRERRLWKKDAEIHSRIGKLYRDAAVRKPGEPGAGKAPRRPLLSPRRGSLSTSLYFDLGILSAAASLHGGEPPLAGNAAPPEKPLEGIDLERAWLAWSDGPGAGAFVPWRPVAHPKLGLVHVGGFRPYTRSNPPPDGAALLAPPQVEFLLGLAERLPRLVIEDAKVDEIAEGVFDVRARVVNRGRLPTALVQGAFTQRRSPLTIELAGGGAKQLGDDARRTIDRLEEDGGARELRWIALAPRGAEVSIDVRRGGVPLASMKLRLESGRSL